jgi:hypothetical protein
MFVHAGYPDALVARMDEAEQKYRVWPDQQGVSEHGADDG